MLASKVKRYLERLDELTPAEVLYSEDIGTLLKLSKKQQENLRARGNFPFPLKRVGRRVCVDKLTVAKWLAEEAKPSGPKAPPSLKKKNRTSAPQSSARPGIGPLLFRKHQQAASLSALVRHNLQQAEFLVEFWTDLAELAKRGKL